VLFRSQDWQAKYGHPVVLLETFVERERFRGTIYRAANWQWVGITAGRTRQDRHTRLQVPVKDIYL
jgi:ribosome maturation factor RimP